MPTGYTANVENGTITTLEQYAAQCMRAFGACINQRDEPFSEPPKLQKPDIGYHYNAIRRAIRAKARVKKTPTKILIQELRRLQEYYSECNESIRNKKVILARYQRMLNKVKAWSPPTPNHLKFKKFMITQLEESIKHDCDLNYYTKERGRVIESLLTLSVEKVCENDTNQAKNDIKYHTMQMRKTQFKCKNANKWIRAVYKTFKKPANNK